MSSPQKPDAAPDSGPQGGMAELLVQLGSEVGAPLGQALERLHALILASKGDQSLMALRDPLRRARDATLLATQIGRLAAGRVQPSSERCALHAMLQQVVEVRRREAQSRGLQLRVEAVDIEVRSDASLLASLLHALLDWALSHTRSSIELNLSLSGWPAQAKLQCRYAWRDLDRAASQAPEDLNGLRWQLVSRTAATLGVPLKREDEAGICVTELGFALFREEVLESLRNADDDDEERRGHDTQPFAGWQALVVSDNPRFQEQAGALMQPQGWALDRAASIDEAFQHCVERLPQAIVVDASALAGADLDQWRLHVLAEAPGFCFIEVAADSATRHEGALHCGAERLEQELPGLLRNALAPRQTDLTFRI